MLHGAILRSPYAHARILAIDAAALIEIRRHRLKLIATGQGTGIIRRESGDYVDTEAVKAELLWARRLCTRRGWPVIDVTRRSVEETAAAIINLLSTRSLSNPHEALA